MTHRCLALYVAKGFAGEHYDNSAQSLTAAAKCSTQSNLRCAGLRESKPLNHLLGKIAIQPDSKSRYHHSSIYGISQLVRLPSIDGAINNEYQNRDLPIIGGLFNRL